MNLKEYLENALKRGNNSHFYLFTKNGSAELATSLILCDSNNNCGNCRQCKLFNTGNHPDLFYISGEGVSNIKDEQLSGLMSFLNTKGFYAKKLVVIKNAEKLTNRAQNRLLKILEDPEDGTFFLLETLEPQLLLETVVSRAIRIDLSPGGELENEQKFAPVNDCDCSRELADAIIKGDRFFVKRELDPEIGKEEIIVKLSNVVEVLRNYLVTRINDGRKATFKIMSIIEQIDVCIRNISSYGNLELNLDNFIYRRSFD